jgi:DNA-binding response OmpR family regulator
MANVLLIEPNRMLGQVYHRALKSAGHSVQTCATAQSAILAADECKPHVVVVELQLVLHSGVEFLYEFRSYADWQAVPVIAHSHVPVTEFGQRLNGIQQQLGIVEYLYKPTTSLTNLLASVQRATATVSA